ncbi:MAG: hypothetical protein ACSHX5_10660 [Phycisphaerales bacterium]
MGINKTPSEGGSGGKRGHSNMEHWGYTEEVKEHARRKRRLDAKNEINNQLKTAEENPSKSDD